MVKLWEDNHITGYFEWDWGVIFLFMPKYDERGLTVSGLVVVFYVWFVLLRFKIRVYEMIPKNWTSFMYVSLFKIHAKLFIACKFALK